MRDYTAKLLFAALLLPVLAFAAPGDERFLAAREAFRVGETTKLARLADELHGNDLEPWARYWLLRLRLNANDDAGVAEFLTRESGTWLAEKLRGEWLKSLGQRGQWETFRREYPALAQADPEIVCYDWQTRLRLQKDSSALDEARPAWFSAVELPSACDPVIDQLVTEKRLSQDDVWQRVRRLLEANNVGEARRAAAYLPERDAPSAKSLAAVMANPARYLDKKLPKNFSASRLGRETALFAVQRLARQDPQEAAERWRKMQNNFSADDQSYVWGQLAMQAARRHMSEALTWYAQADDKTLADEQLAWKVRAALRALNWTAVDQTVANMPAALRERPEWSYWRGRALAALGKVDEARLLYRQIEHQSNFYGNLAADELGVPVTLPPRAQPASTEELAAVAANPGVKRALALFRLDMRLEGTREWNWSMRGMSDRQLLASAELARRNDVFDRAIFSAEHTLEEHDYALRYLAPFRDQVSPKDKELDLDDGWVYGLMRQESRFIMGAKSGVGAKGLMQLMPKTAKWVARKIGLSGFHAGQVTDMDTNLTLGTNYLKMVFTSLDNHPVLASAAYNAGPGRARQWLGDAPMEGAIYIESIPFNETRDYVKKVMSNSIYYAILFDEKPRSLKSRLGVIQPRGGLPRGSEALP
jgi:soluble lytic murein transglycosylase